MPVHRFFQLDVFTREPLAGNPLAVFPDADGIDTATMQALAREMNLSETTFVLPSSIATARVRFFTPTSEIPLAGHPTIGTWWLLAELGLTGDSRRDGLSRVTQETGRGVLPVEIGLVGGAPARVVMTQALPTNGAIVSDIAGLGVALGGDEHTVMPIPAPQVVSTALPQLMVPVASEDVLASLPSGGTGMSLASRLRELGTDCAMCFAPPVSDHLTRLTCRMFAPGIGVPEDPATGSAAGALGAYLVSHGMVEAVDGTVHLVVEQGGCIGRPSVIHVEVRVSGRNAITEVRVGGEAIRVIEGEVRV